KVKAFSLGGADYIAKPFQIEEAIARVEHQLTIQSLCQQLANQNRDLKNANEQLHLEIAERKRMEIERDRLLKSERVANLAKDDFVSTVSHELRSPLANMQMAIRMLLLGAEAEKRDRYLNILQEECKRETALINDLLDWQRLSAGGIPLNVEAIDLSEWLMPLVNPFIDRANVDRRSLHLSVPPSIPEIATDTKLLERVVTELLNNACKYTPANGSITLIGRAEVRQTPAGEPLPARAVELIFSNTTAPIPPEAFARIFERFYRIETANPRHQGGTGLGLALVHKFVELLGGTISVTSQPEVITFVVTLPLTLPAQSERASYDR
ncbi:MAG: ATP-binding protein, partial [Cyanobacteria bacterium J06648_11]